MAYPAAEELKESIRSHDRESLEHNLSVSAMAGDFMMIVLGFLLAYWLRFYGFDFVRRDDGVCGVACQERLWPGQAAIREERDSGHCRRDGRVSLYLHRPGHGAAHGPAHLQIIRRLRVLFHFCGHHLVAHVSRMVDHASIDGAKVEP